MLHEGTLETTKNLGEYCVISKWSKHICKFYQLDDVNTMRNSISIFESNQILP